MSSRLRIVWAETRREGRSGASANSTRTQQRCFPSGCDGLGANRYPG